MTMPILPALMGTADAASPPSLVDVISALDDGQINELVATAEAAGFGGEAPAAEDVNPDLEQPEAPTVDNDEAGSEEGVDEAAPESEEGEGTDEEEVADMEQSMDATAIVSSAEAAYDGLDPKLQSLQTYLESAEEGVEGG